LPSLDPVESPLLSFGRGELPQPGSFTEKIESSLRIMG
jgi:hypothetical protein